MSLGPETTEKSSDSRKGSSQLADQSQCYTIELYRLGAYRDWSELARYRDAARIVSHRQKVCGRKTDGDADCFPSSTWFPCDAFAVKCRAYLHLCRGATNQEAKKAIHPMLAHPCCFESGSFRQITERKKKYRKGRCTPRYSSFITSKHHRSQPPPRAICRAT